MYYKGHIAAGAISAASAAVIATNSTDIQTITTNILLCSLSSLLTSQLPDVDTPESRISKAFPIMKIITGWVVLAIEFCCICMLICTFQIAKERITIQHYRNLIYFILIFGVQVWLKIVLRHRGVTHTILFNMILAAAVFYPYYIYKMDKYYFYFALGAAVGLFSHLLFDSITIQGCPLWSPLYKNNIKLLKRFRLRSGKDDKYGVGFCFIVFVVILTQKIVTILNQ